KGQMARLDVGHFEVESRRLRAVLEEQTGVAEIEEREPGWIERRDERQPEHVTVERDRPVEVGCTLRDLVERADTEVVGHRGTICLPGAGPPGSVPSVTSTAVRAPYPTLRLERRL